jgi:hypothetical protein
LGDEMIQSCVRVAVCEVVHGDAPLI